MGKGALLAMLMVPALGPRLAADEVTPDYRLLATNATSTLERELNGAAFDGWRFAAMHAGETAFGGREVVVGLERDPDEAPWHRYDYVVLATSRTSTMRSELARAAADGFRLVGQAVSETGFGGREVVAVMERDVNGDGVWSYELLATNRTSTMERELREAGRRGFVLRGLSVGVTAFGGPEVVAFLERPARNARPEE